MKASLAARIAFFSIPILSAPVLAQNRALSFNGGQCVAIAWNAALDFDEQVTVEGWIYPTNLNGYNTLLRKNVNYLQDNYDLRLDGGRTLEFLCKINGSMHRFSSSFSFQTNRWYHIAGTFDGNALRSYADGQLVGTYPCPGRLAMDRVMTYIGHGDGDYVRGRIDEVRLWSVARTEGQIREAKNHGVDPTNPDLVGYWRFDETDGQVAIDATGHGLDGVLGETTAVGADDPARVLSDAPVSCIWAESVDPPAIPTAGGEIRIACRTYLSFEDGEVRIDGTPAEVMAWSDEEIVFVAPAHLDGAVDGLIRTSCGDAEFSFLYRSHFVRGDVDGVSAINLGDAIAILNHLFADHSIACADAADANDSGSLEIGDAIGLLMYLFADGLRPPAPFPDPGPDPTDDVLRCGR
ncbi:MAG: hypothetical protein JXP34_10960 [Planctomycetes bacterium]|nr:hypothetical protein [Planctomycetota bacterium]